jgi:hypothetical protein
VAIVLIAFTVIPTIFSFDMNNDDQHDDKVDEIRQAPLSSYVSSLPYDKSINPPECLLKSQLAHMLHRDRRASISRPYFYHWRSARDNGRYSTKNSLAFSPRLGKRFYSDETEFDHEENRMASRSTIDSETFLSTFVAYLKTKKIYVVYEDSNRICLSQSINDALIQSVINKFDANGRNQDRSGKEEVRSKQVMGKHPVLFRYRLG